MYSIFDSRLVVQKSIGQSKFYLQVISATVEQSSLIPTASVEVIATNGTIDYLAAIAFDDIVWLEVSTRYSSYERVVWKKIFEGRIITQREQWGNGSTATVLCVGNAFETAHKLILPKTPGGVDIMAEFPAGTDAGQLATAFNGLLTRSEIRNNYATTFQTTYKTKYYQKYIKDVMNDIYEMSGGNYIFETYTVYNSAQLATDCKIYLYHVDTVPTAKIMSGTPRLLSANFESDGGEVWNYRVQLGATPEGGAQYIGVSYSEDSIDKYHSRQIAEVDTALNSNAMCKAAADGKLALSQNPKITGSATIIGTPEIKWKKLVTVVIDPIRLNGSTLNANLRVESIRHNISRSGYTTELDFGSLRKSTDEYMAEFALKNRLTQSQFIS